MTTTLRQFFSKVVTLVLSLTIALLTIGCASPDSIAEPTTPLPAENANYSKATFAGGCFWCMEKPFDEINGVVSSISGYTGGTKENPTYREVSGGGTGHTESVQITYDPTKVKYETLLKTFWRNIDPVDPKGQFCDKGSQYRSGIFYETPEQQKLAAASKEELDKSGKLPAPIVTEITAASTFYPAEDYHQNYYQTTSAKYKLYRFGCGRDRRLTQIWGDEAGH
jgi:peptide-methionine (S)-S-oxide reductase